MTTIFNGLRLVMDRVLEVACCGEKAFERLFFIFALGIKYTKDLAKICQKMKKNLVQLALNQTCIAQSLKMSHFGELPDVVWPKIAQKCQI